MVLTHSCGWTWTGDFTFARWVPQLVQLAANKWHTVAECYQVDTGDMIWFPQLGRGLKDDEDAAFVDLLDMLQNIQIDPCSKDAIGAYEDNGIFFFSVKSQYSMMEGNQYAYQKLTEVWKVKSPLKI